MHCATADSKKVGEGRDGWCTARNLKKMFEVQAEVLVEYGVAIRNPKFDDSVSMSEPILITHPQLMHCYDEVMLSPSAGAIPFRMRAVN